MDNGFKLKQLQYENDASRRMLEFLLLENAILKTRLAEFLLEESVSGYMLETAEVYQAWFIQKDEIINLMRQEIAGLDDMLTRFLHENGGLKAITKKQKKLRQELKHLERAFEELKSRFDSFLESFY